MEKIKKMFSSKSSRNGTYSVGLAVIVIAIAIVINLVAGQLPEKVRNIDISSNNLYDISSVSTKMLKKLDKKVDLKVIAEQDSVDTRIKTFVKKYAALSGKVKVEWVDSVLHPRNPETNKNDYGRILCVCGSAGYTGAAYFSAQGAVRMGSGVVTLAVPQGAWPVLAVKLNEPVVRPMPQDENGLFSMDALSKLLALAEKADALLIGCGLGRSDTLTEIVCTLLEKAACQIVLDADGINSITGHKDILRRTAKPVVLTPHAGEFARLSGKPDATAADAAQFAQDYRCIVLYKGHRTRIFTPDGGCYRNTSGNPGMAKGGSGDVLAGMLVSLCGQGIDAVSAACTAAWLHGRAGDLAANALSEYGMTPSDMLTQLPILLKRYNSKTW